jgi:hypothetical protein
MLRLSANGEAGKTLQAATIENNLTLKSKRGSLWRTIAHTFHDETA